MGTLASSPIDTPGWHQGDVGKTVAMPTASNILLLACRNHTHCRGLVLIRPMLKHTYPGKAWSLYDLRPFANQANIVNQVNQIG